jgi:hypothetical protein
MKDKMETHTKDVTGKVICLGDRVGYDLEGDRSTFEIVFEDNAFRKKYDNWDNTYIKPMLEFGREAEIMRLKIIKSKN